MEAQIISRAYLLYYGPNINTDTEHTEYNRVKEQPSYAFLQLHHFRLKVPRDILPVENDFYSSIPSPSNPDGELVRKLQGSSPATGADETGCRYKTDRNNKTLFRAITTLFSPLPIFIIPGEHYSSIGGEDCGKPDDKY